MKQLNSKIDALYNEIKKLGSIVIAFSGGVDSTFLAATAKKVLGDQVVAVTVCSDSLTFREKADAIAVAKFIDIKHVLMAAPEFKNPLFIANTSDRCYYCKKDRFTKLLDYAKTNGYAYVAEGSNIDDLDDYRPGMKAIKELGVIKSPLLAAGFTKAEIRDMSKALGLPTWNRPSAACLVSRLSYGQRITVNKLKQVEQGEKFLCSLVSGQVRLRHHGDLARIEVDADNIATLAAPRNAKVITNVLHKLGFKYVTLDLVGYRMGSMNDSLREE